jgi:hypothetical protein
MFEGLSFLLGNLVFATKFNKPEYRSVRKREPGQRLGGLIGVVKY